MTNPIGRTNAHLLQKLVAHEELRARTRRIRAELDRLEFLIQKKEEQLNG
jgi:nitrogen-specific signal transduction histidine kinase